jgi:hypothetical protein
MKSINNIIRCAVKLFADEPSSRSDGHGGSGQRGGSTVPYNLLPATYHLPDEVREQ